MSVAITPTWELQFFDLTGVQPLLLVIVVNVAMKLYELVVQGKWRRGR